MMVRLGSNILAATIVCFLDSLIMSLGALLHLFLLPAVTDLLAVGGEVVDGMKHGIL